MRLKIIGTSFILALWACQTANPPASSGKTGSQDHTELGMKPVDMSKIDLGPFNSKILKISWFRFAQIFADVSENGKTVTQRVRWEPQWFGIFSYDWLRERGFRAHEDYLTVRDPKTGKSAWALPDIKMFYNDMGFPDADVRQMIANLMLNAHLMEIPEANPALLSPDWLRRMQRMPLSDQAWEREVGLVRILVVESDKGRRILLHYSTRDNPELFAKSKKLHGEAGRLVANYAPQSGGMKIDPEK
jgi:hypothetical protein